jgi:hypothetical protein
MDKEILRFLEEHVPYLKILRQWLEEERENTSSDSQNIGVYNVK